MRRCGWIPFTGTRILLASIGRGLAIVSFSCAFASAQSKKTPKPAVAKPLSNWSMQIDRSKMDDSRTVTLTVRANGAVEGWLERSHPSLIVRCREGKTNVFVVTGLQAQPEYGKFEEATVRFRLDDQSPDTETWSESTDSKALFAPEPIALIQRLLKAKRLRFELRLSKATARLLSFRSAASTP